MDKNITDQNPRGNPSDNANEQPRELILQLGQMVTNRLRYTVTKDDPEYWGLDALLTDEMAKIALKMKVRKPRTLKDMVKLTNKDPEELEKILHEMSILGVIEYNWENPKREKQWVLPMFVPGSAEFTNMNEDLLKEHPEMGRFFERMSRLPLEKVTPFVPPGGAGIGMHVIPVEKAIKTENQSIDIEHISHWLKKYDGKYAASPCSCRMSRKTYDEGCADDPRDWCLAMGDMADYVVETNKGGRYITYEEALDILKQAEDNGFVHQITNIDGEDKIFAICNCNINVCYALRTSQLFNTPNLSRSAYVAKVEKEDCVACGRCVEYCPAGAVQLGQKLCASDGSEIQYPKQELPDAVEWGPEKWDEDYRDNNRINTHESGTAPCKTNCPAHIAVQGYLKKAAKGEYQEALALIKKENPFPAVCGRVCNRRCEDACTRGEIDQAIAIDEVKKFIAQQDLNADTRYIPPVIRPSVRGPFSEKVAIIGGGPAGLSCAFYLAEKGYSPTVFEKNKKPGGMLTYGIPSFKLEKNVVDAEIDVIREMGVDIKCNVNVGTDVTIEELRKQGYKAFYIAIGCQGKRTAGILGEDAEGVFYAVDFLKDVTESQIDNNDGTSSAGHKVTGKSVVIGGGNVAIDAARTAGRCGSDDVSMYCLESRDIMPASLEEIEEAEDEGIKINCEWGPKEILSNGGKVTGIVLKKCISVFDENGKFAPKYDENETITVECDNVYLSIGQSIVWDDLLKDTDVKFRKNGGVIADPITFQTDEPDIFVGGDVYTGPKFAIDAIATGKEGAISIHRFVQPNSSLVIGRNPNYFTELDKEDILVESYDKSPRQIPNTRTDVDHRKTFSDVREIFTEEQVKTETERCLGCGATIVDENKCIGCGVCTTKCEFDAISLERERPECSTMVPSEKKVKKLLPYMLKRKIKIKRAAK